MESPQQYHLKRTGPPSTLPDVLDIMDLNKLSCVFGRHPTMVDYLLDSKDHIQSIIISRCHARIVRQKDGSHRLYDESLNGIYINNFKIHGYIDLNEGDKVTFGHPSGKQIEAGKWVRQPDSQYQFIYERCDCKFSDVTFGRKGFTPKECEAVRRDTSRERTLTLTDYCPSPPRTLSTAARIESSQLGDTQLTVTSSMSDYLSAGSSNSPRTHLHDNQSIKSKTKECTTNNRKLNDGRIHPNYDPLRGVSKGDNSNESSGSMLQLGGVVTTSFETVVENVGSIDTNAATVRKTEPCMGSDVKMMSTEGKLRDAADDQDVNGKVEDTNENETLGSSKMSQRTSGNMSVLPDSMSDIAHCTDSTYHEEDVKCDDNKDVLCIKDEASSSIPIDPDDDLPDPIWIFGGKSSGTSEKSMNDVKKSLNRSKKTSSCVAKLFGSPVSCTTLQSPKDDCIPIDKAGSRKGGKMQNSICPNDSVNLEDNSESGFVVKMRNDTGMNEKTGNVVTEQESDLLANVSQSAEGTKHGNVPKNDENTRNKIYKKQEGGFNICNDNVDKCDDDSANDDINDSWIKKNYSEMSSDANDKRMTSPQMSWASSSPHPEMHSMYTTSQSEDEVLSNKKCSIDRQSGVCSMTTDGISPSKDISSSREDIACSSLGSSSTEKAVPESFARFASMPPAVSRHLPVTRYNKKKHRATDNRENSRRDAPSDKKTKLSRTVKDRGRDSKCDINAVHDKGNTLDLESKVIGPAKSFERNGSSHSGVKRSRARELLDRLKAKRVKVEVKVEATEEDGSEKEAMEEMQSSQNVHLMTAENVMIDNAHTYTERCKCIVSHLYDMLSADTRIQDLSRVKTWKDELEKFRDVMEPPKTVIAVVGDTGAGKSCLMNALLGHYSILPTSGMRACTSVVVEISLNTENDQYQAHIDFLEPYEWFDELESLLQDLTQADGKLYKRQPDPNSEAGLAFSKIRAVYGRIDELKELKRQTSVTKWLGKTKTITDSHTASFRQAVDRYIESTDVGSGGQFWPVVKQVRLRVPNCAVCSSGAVLVDLPGIRDSNNAREKIAKEYLKKCNAVWVVASIHRAIDDKTAKDLLGESFRRQLLMDGQYGSISFICTKTDVLTPSEIIRERHLDEECREFQKKIKSLETESDDLKIEVRRMKRGISPLSKEVADVTEEWDDMRRTVEEVETVLQQEELESDSCDDQWHIDELKKECEEKGKLVRTKKDELSALEHGLKRKQRKVVKLASKLAVEQKSIAAICASARSAFSKQQIRRDFKAGLTEMRRDAGALDDDDDDGMHDIVDDGDTDVGSRADQLDVFCVSSIEFFKLTNLLRDDGPARVFSSPDQTGIPSLRQHVHRMTSVRRLQHVERLIRNISGFVADVNAYIADEGTESSGTRLSAVSLFKTLLADFHKPLESLLDGFKQQLREAFDKTLLPRVTEGANNAARVAVDTSNKWGSKVNRDNRSSGGYPYTTYRATVRRYGRFKSPTVGPIDFNEQLSEPIYASITVCWDNIFSGLLSKILDDCRISVLSALRQFACTVERDLSGAGVTTSRITRLSTQVEARANQMLKESIVKLQASIVDRQREISRLVTPSVQGFMISAYKVCTANCFGLGAYNRMKETIFQHVETHKSIMFDQASSDLLSAIDNLQNHIVDSMRNVCTALTCDLGRMFEPLWEEPSNTEILKHVVHSGIKVAENDIRTLSHEAGITEALPATPPRAIATVATMTCHTQVLSSGTEVKFSMSQGSPRLSVNEPDARSTKGPQLLCQTTTNYPISPINLSNIKPSRSLDISCSESVTSKVHLLLSEPNVITSLYQCQPTVTSPKQSKLNAISHQELKPSISSHKMPKYECMIESQQLSAPDMDVARSAINFTLNSQIGSHLASTSSVDSQIVNVKNETESQSECLGTIEYSGSSGNVKNKTELFENILKIKNAKRF